jgi:hypothetical protein
MSTYGWANITGVDNDSNSTPGGIDGSVQYNDNGINFAGVSDFTYQDTTKTLNVVNISATSIVAPNISAAGSNTNVQYNKAGILAGDAGFQYDDNIGLASITNLITNNIRPGVIEDNTFSTGSNNQVLASDGSFSNNLVWVNQYAPGAPFNSIQFNDNGVFGGSANFVRNPSTNAVNINGNLGIGSLTAPPDRLTVNGSNATASVITDTATAQVVIRTSDTNQKQFTFQVNGPANTGDITSIQQGVQFRPIRLNPSATLGQARVSIGTTDSNAVLQLDQSLTNRKIVLFQGANNDTQYYGFGVQPNTLRYNVSGTGDNHVWFAGTGGGTSSEIMRLTGTGNLCLGATAAVPRLFALSTTALFTGSGAWNNQWMVAGVDGTAGGPGVGLGFNSASNYGALLCVDPGNSFRPMYYTASTHIFGTTDGVERVRIIDNGNVGIGTNAPGFRLEVNGTIRSTSVRPDTILDTANAAGTAGQLLSSTGSGLQWTNHARGPAYAIQFNSGTGVNPVMDGTANLTWTGNISNTFTVNGTALIDLLQANNEQITFKLAVGTLTASVPRIFAQSGSASFAISSWDDQWIMAGAGGSGTSAGIGMGYSTAGNFGVITCIEPLATFKPIIYNAFSHDFKVNNSTRMTVTNTPGGDGLVTTHTLQATQIRDGFLNTGTNGQVLTSTGIGLLWDELTPRYFFDTNATFQGTTGHRIYVSIQKKGTLYSVQVSMQRDGGIHFDLVSPALTVGTQIIATLPVGWRPPASVDGIGYASNNNTWASTAFNWGSLNIDTSGNIRMRSPASGGPVTTIQPNLEQITCNIFWLSSGTIYNSDGITR